jgi:hypothetical protein
MDLRRCPHKKFKTNFEIVFSEEKIPKKYLHVDTRVQI